MRKGDYNGKQENVQVNLRPIHISEGIVGAVVCAYFCWHMKFTSLYKEVVCQMYQADFVVVILQMDVFIVKGSTMFRHY